MIRKPSEIIRLGLTRYTGHGQGVYMCHILDDMQDAGEILPAERNNAVAHIMEPISAARCYALKSYLIDTDPVFAHLYNKACNGFVDSKESVLDSAVHQYCVAWFEVLIRNLEQDGN